MKTDPRIPTSAPLEGDALERLDAKQRMIVTAAKLFQRQGYHATGLKQVVVEARAPRGSIYHHFPGGKEELGVQAVRVAAGELTRAIRRATDRATEPGDLARRLGRALARWLVDSDYLEGCPVSTVTLETAPVSPPLTEACREAYAEWVELIAEPLRERGHAPAQARALATTVVAAFEGALLLARASTSTEPLDLVVEQMGRLLEAEPA